MPRRVRLLPELEQAIRTAGDAEHAGNVVVKMKTA